MTNASPNPSVPAPHPSPWTNKALWFLGLALFANAAVILYTHITGRAPDLILSQSAFAQSTPGTGLGARGIYMMPAQLGPQTFGLYLMDLDSSTITVYRAVPETSRLRLMAARSFRNDRFLEDYNNDNPTPKQVQKLVADQRQRHDLESKTGEPTVDQNPKPDENKPDGK